jgi:hypothetical protein
VVICDMDMYSVGEVEHDRWLFVIWSCIVKVRWNMNGCSMSYGHL